MSQPLWCAPFSLERDRTGLPGPRCGLTASLSDTTIWRWLNEDAIRPWQHRCWIFPRDRQFAAKAGRILDLYQRLWKGRKLSANEFVVSADEKTSIQARSRKAKSLPTQPGQPMKIEHEYKRLGAWAYLAALDVHRAKLFGRCEPKNGIAAFDRLVDQVRSEEHTSELQSHHDLVCRLLLEKKKK